ncbi:MAG: peptidylprolyl isomerase [Gammaproteobacteria bacterium]|nr:peptidylprolyl isomerase [Gammaproteobacteria bacterium]
MSSVSFAADPVKVKVITNKGDIFLELYPDKAPETVKNFVNYAEMNFYKKTIFHRVIDGFMIQGGGFTNAQDRKKTLSPIQNEADNGLKNDRGTIAMARTRDPHSATAQFFINLKNNDFLNHTRKSMNGWGYTVFGKVTKGMDVVDKIAKVKTTKTAGQQNIPVDPIYIEDVTLIK